MCLIRSLHLQDTNKTVKAKFLIGIVQFIFVLDYFYSIVYCRDRHTERHGGIQQMLAFSASRIDISFILRLYFI